MKRVGVLLLILISNWGLLVNAQGPAKDTAFFNNNGAGISTPTTAPNFHTQPHQIPLPTQARCIIMAVPAAIRLIQCRIID